MTPGYPMESAGSPTRLLGPRWSRLGGGASRHGLALRAIEQTDGGLGRAHGRTVYDRHAALPEALEHLHGIAETISPAQLVVHRLDGTVQNLGYA